MNKNRYKLIFSKVKGCLVPVAECINSAISNGSSDSETTTESEAEEPPLLAHPLSPVSLWVKSTLNPVSSVMQLTWKQVSILFLTVISVPALAETEKTEKAKLTEITNNGNEHIKLDGNKGNNATSYNTQLHKTENSVIVIDIATPNQKGISDNRFEKFNIPNGAVFNNNGSEAEKRSRLIGYVPHNKNLTSQNEASVILNQVTGSQESKIAGALEVLGKKADIVIANQNGINLNGVRTINSDRFVATTSHLIDPNDMQLNVTKGNVTIDVNGVSTDGLQYLDVIAKTIEQKQSITPEHDIEAKANVTFIAGTSKYDLEKNELQKNSGGSVSNNSIAITGASTGAMHGQNIKLIVTDKGAGIKHDGIILSEKDIKIELHDGDLDLGNTAQETKADSSKKVQAKNNLEVKGAKRTTIGSELKAEKIEIQSDETKLKEKAEVRANQTANISSKVSVSIEQNAKLVAVDVNTTTESLTNEGRIYGRDVKINANDLVNKKEIYSENKLTIQTKGKNFTVNEDGYTPFTLLKNEANLKPGFLNTGLIESGGDVELTFKDESSFLTKGNKFIKAKDNLTINAKNIEIDKDQNIQLGANITFNVTDSFINNAGTVASGQSLSINASKGNIYNLGGILGAAESLRLIAKSDNEQKGSIINQKDGLLHTLGNMTLSADRKVYNIGEISADKKLAVDANQLINDVSLSGKLSYKTIGASRLYDISRVAKHGWHINVYQLNVDLQELDKADVKILERGAIRSNGDFEFTGKALPGIGLGDKESKLINHGLINVKGTFKAQADKVINQMKGFEQNALETVFKNPAKIKVYYQPRTRYIWTALSGNASREFDSLGSFLDALFSPSPITSSASYSAENFSAYEILRHVEHSPIYQKAMAQVFGAEWHKKSYEVMKKDWNDFKENPTNFTYYPTEKARILADKLEGKLQGVQNGETSQYGSFDGNLQIGKHSLTLPKVEFKPEFSDTENLDNSELDIDSIIELLETPNLFIDRSIQLEKEGLPPIEDLNAFSEKDEDKNNNSSNEKNNNLGTDHSKLNNGLDESGKPLRTDTTIDYLNPEEYLDNGYLLNQLLKELNEKPLIKEGDNPLNRAKNIIALSNLEKEKYGHEGPLSEKIDALFKQKQKEQEIKRKAETEKALAEKTKQQEKRLEESKQEEKRQEQDKVAKQAEIAKEIKQAEEISKKEKELEIQIQAKEKQQQEEKRVAEEKKQAEQQKKAEEKAAKEKLEVEQQKAYEETARHEADASKNSLLKAIDDDRPKVETDPLYRTKLKYINQDEYAGANYFFNKLGLDTKGNQKVNVLGDNYFDHQLITRTIEKKTDNRLNQKYNLTDVDLVKKLMDNSTSQAKELDLKLGASLTKEQQAKLTEDIIWYVKTKVNGKDVFVPQVYFASETLADAKKLQGLGTGVISAGEVNIKAENVVNTGTLAGTKLNVEASNKIQNKGSILSTKETRLVGHKGIENLSRSFANDELGVTAQRSEIRTEGHLHLETDKDASIDVQASDIKAKSGFVKTGDLNLKDTHNTKHSYHETFSPSSLQLTEMNIGGIKVPILSMSSASSHSEHKSEATSVGSKLSIDQLHLAVEKDVNQVGSDLEAKRISGIVKGNYNTEAGKNIKHSEQEDYSSQLVASAHASGGGTSVRYDYNSKDGGKASVGVPTNHTGVGADAGISITHTKEKETLLTHTNSELQVESGKLHVLGHADIGGVDINTKLPADVQSKATNDTAASHKDNTANSQQGATQPSTANKANEAPALNALSEAEIAELMSEKSQAYFEEQAKKAPDAKGFELSAKEIKSSKQKDQYDHESERTSFKIGPEIEAHSAIADMVSHLVKEYRDAQNGIKQDGTVALQQASDVLNIITGDLAGSSAKLAVERNRETKRTTETGDIVTKIGGKVTLSAHGGSVELKNVRSDENTDLTLKAKEDVNILAGEKTRETQETASRQKLAHGVNAGCSMMTGACTAGVSTSLEGSESYTYENEKTHNNSVLQGQNIKIEAGRDLNLVSSNIDANNVDLKVEGKTNVVSKQDTLQKTTHGFDYSVSAGVALSSATIATPTGNIGGGYTNETETARTVNQQAGIKANKLTGQINDLNLEGGHIVSKDNSKDLKVKGNVTTKALHDQHDKDGGSFGLSVGISERGTTAFNIRGGRSDQKHYNATQNATISGVDTSKANVSGQVNTDLAKAKDVTRDDTYASTQFSFEVADIVELGQKAKNRLTTPKAGNDDAPSASFRSRPVADETDSVSVKNPIYESADAVVQTPRKNADNVELVDNPLYGAAPRAKATEAENNLAKSHDYEEIPAGVYNKVGDSSSDLARNRAAKTDDHIYAEISDPTYSTIGDKNADVKRNQSTVTTEYAEAGQPRARRANDPLPELPGQTKAKVATETSENIYAEIADSKAKRALPATPDAQAKTPSVDSTYATVEAPKAKVADSDYATIAEPKAKSIDSTYATVEAPKAKVTDSDYATIAEPKAKSIDSTYATVEAPKAKVADSDYATIAEPKAKSIDSTYATVDAPKAKVADSDYATIAEPKAKSIDSTYATVDAPKAKVADSDYATIAEPKERKARNANDPLPELPGQRKGKVATEVDSADHIYAEIADNSKAKRPLPDAPESKAKRPLPDTPESNAKVQVSDSEGDYATINPAPKVGQAQDAEVAETLQPRSKANSAESDYETIPAADNAPTANTGSAGFRRVGNTDNADNADSHVEPKVRSVSEENSAANASAPKAKAEDGVDNTQAVAKSEKAEKSFLSKVKDFFTGGSNKEKKAKATKPAQEEAQAQVATKPNYDGLEDNLNLKNLLDLEGQRNEAFESNVLKNPEFLAEAREAAKKYIPEATIKQMGNSPEFDDILTEGARKVEKRINDAVSFKPSVEEFNDIQGLVKQLPKGDVIDDVNVKTLSITEALAETSKTIQRNPKLKEEVQGAIEEFLKSSQGKDLTVEMIEKLNHGLRPDEGADRLLYKKETLTKENAVFSSPEAAKIQLGETVDFINRAKQQGIEPSVLAGLVYQRLIAYHPFAEGNGRMARVIVNKLLLDAGYPPFTKFSPEFETQIIPQTNSTAKSATSTEVVKEFLTELGKKPLPEVNSTANSKPKAGTEEPVYATVDKRPEALAKAKARGDEAAQQQPLKANVAEEVVPTLPKRPADLGSEAETRHDVKTAVDSDVEVKAKAQVDEDIYATVNKSPEARAKANAKADEALAKNPIVKVQVEDDDVPPALPIRPELKDAAGINSKSKVKSEDTASSAEKTSFFGKIKQLFTGSESSKSAKAAKQEDTTNAKPNYDGLEDSVNLKNLLDLEGKRNEAFETNVLKNAEFLAEAREAAKKYIPEATIKQMGNSPEFDDILTEGARKVEKRINDAVTFKPTVEEFSEIQGLVKQLPKGDVIEDVNVKTQSITEALAETSKTIQRNPKLKEEVQGAIEEFLKSSQGKDLTVEMIEKLNHGLRPDEGADRQLYKKETLTKENAVFSSPEASKIQLSETVDFINQARSQGVEPSVLAGLVYQRLIAYHPFAEGNGRMARVIVNKLLLDAGYPPFTKFNSEFETQIIPQTNTTAKSATSSEVVKEFLTELGKKGDAIQKPVAKPAEQNSVETNRTLEQAIGAAAFRKANVETEQPKAAVPTAEAKAEVSKPVSERVQQKELVEQSRGVLKQVQDQFQPLKVKHKIDDVRSSVEQYGGEVSFKYAQSKGEVYKEIVKHVETQHGVCESTCAHWIANKVSNQGDDFWNTLYEGGKKGHLKQETIDSIKKLQTEFMNSGSATQQFKLTDSWLQEQGVVPKEKKVGNASRRDEVAGTVSKTDISALTKAILDTGSDNSGVKKISINLEGGSHTVSAAVQGEKVVFFDPNFGEMTFPSHKQFESWLKGAFWEKSGYAGKKDGKRFFNVVNYELPADAEKPKAATKPVVANEQDVPSKKHGFSNPFRSKGKDNAEGPKIEHLGGSADKDAFYFPLDKIVTKDRGISKDMKVNLENIKKAFNPKDKHYNSSEAKNLRAMYEQDPTMSSTRFVIGNQVIENPFKSQDLQAYIQKHHVKTPDVAAKTAKPLPALPTGKVATEQNAAPAVAKKPVQPPKPKAQGNQPADPNAIYAQVNKKKAQSADKVEGFYSESQLKTRSDKIVEQVSHVPTTEPVYADLQFRHNGKAKVHQGSSEVVYDEVATKVKGQAPKTAEKPQKPQKPQPQLSKGFIPESQLKTRSDKIVEQVSHVPTTEPVYADLQFRHNGKAKVHQGSSDVVYDEVATKVKGQAPKTAEKPQKPQPQLSKGFIPESQLKTRSDKIVEQVSHVPTTEPVYADLQFQAGKTQRVISSQQETIYEEVGKKPQEEPIYQNVIRKGVNHK
ncbi:YopT-type cysteine protease domain-containing protein [Pasteurella sp. PK-2025]|uniref:YopT-type cysteine protease domain-containing protein n=1 Tax=Pasteurella sp. PK-2025 TaxID=3413133 RepID=UPI003C78C193